MRPDCPARSSGSSDTYKAPERLADLRARPGRRKGGTKLALNLDIDNTSLATYYDTGKPVAATLRLVKYAKSKGVYILFNTGRNVSLRAKTIASSSAPATRSTASAPTTRARRCGTASSAAASRS